MKPETRLTIGNYLMMGGFAAIAIGLIILSGFTFPQAHAQNMTEYNATLNTLDNFFNQKQNLSIFYLLFFLVAFFMFMLAAIALRHKQWSGIFAIAALVFSLLVAFYFMVPVDFVYITNNTRITAEQIEWLDGNVTQNTSVIKDENMIVLVPYDPQLRMVIAGIFMVLTVFNGMFAILIFTNQLEKK